MRRGFTLVEVLIVIAIVGILSSTMLLSSGSAVSSARATAVISDLHTMKQAFLMLYIDSMDYFADSSNTSVSTTALSGYLEDPSKLNSGYTITKSANNWFVGYNVSQDEALRNSLAGRASSVGLYKDTNKSPFAADGETVYMLAR